MSKQHRDHELEDEHPRPFFVPHYDELSLFLMSVACAALLAVDATMRQDLMDLAEKRGGRIWLAVITLALGMLLSTWHVFTHRKKTSLEKSFMLIFAVAANAGAGILGAIHVLGGSQINVWILFPLWNLLSAVMLLVLFRLEVIDKSAIGDEDVSARQALVGAGILAVVLSVSHLLLKNHWAITFSLSIALSTHVVTGVAELMARRSNRL